MSTSPFTNLRVIDFETSNLPEKGGKIIEIGWTDLTVNHQGAIFHHPSSSSIRFGLPNGEKIDHAAKATHGIWENELPAWNVLTPATLQTFLDCPQSPSGRFDYLVAHNAKFEQAMLELYNCGPTKGYESPPFICTMKVARRVWPHAEKHTLPFLRYHANLENGERDFRCDPSHAAGPDTWLTAKLFATYLRDFSISIEEMVNFTIQPEFHAFCPLGKYKGQEWSAVDTGYLVWILKTTDMEEGIKQAAGFELKGRSVPKW